MSVDVNDICQNWWAREVSAENGQARKTRAQLRRADTLVKALGLEAVPNTLQLQHLSPSATD